MASGRRRVVVTGIGCVTPLGVTVESLWKNLVAGRSGVGMTTVFDASRFPTKISAEVRDWDITDEGEKAEDWQYCGRHTRFAAGAALQAMRDAGLPKGLESDPTRMGIYLGSGEGQQALRRLYEHDDGGHRRRDARRRQVHEAGSRDAPPADGSRAGAEHARRPLGCALRRRGPESQLPHSLCRVQPSDRRSGRNRSPRRGRRHAVRRLPQHDPSFRRDGLQFADGPLDAERRADACQPSLRQRARWLRAR